MATWVLRVRVAEVMERPRAAMVPVTSWPGVESQSVGREERYKSLRLRTGYEWELVMSLVTCLVLGDGQTCFC